MKNCHLPENQTTRRILLITCVMALAVSFTVALPQAAHADLVTPPPVPSNIEVPAGNTAFLEGHAVGTQNYICLLSGWTFFGPQATLFNDLDEQVVTHFLSPNPDEGGTARATWQHSQDTSTVWGVAIASYTPAFVCRRRTHHRRHDAPGLGCAAHGLRGPGLARELFFPVGFAHSIVGGSAWEPTPWRAVQRAA
jgi:hypothetical protein